MIESLFAESVVCVDTYACCGKSQKQGNNNTINTNKNKSSNKSSYGSSAFHKMMLAKDAESGYTSLLGRNQWHIKDSRGRIGRVGV